MGRITPPVSRAVRTVLGPPARPVTVTNMLQRYRQAMYTYNYVRPGEEFNPPVHPELIISSRPTWKVA